MFINSDNDRLVTVDWDYPGENKKILNKKTTKKINDKNEKN